MDDVLNLSPDTPVGPVTPLSPVGPVEPVGPSIPSKFTLYVAFVSNSSTSVIFLKSVNTNVPSAESYELTVASKRLLGDELFTTTTELPVIYANCVPTISVIISESEPEVKFAYKL